MLPEYPPLAKTLLIKVGFGFKKTGYIKYTLKQKDEFMQELLLLLLYAPIQAMSLYACSGMGKWKANMSYTGNPHM